MPTVRSLVVVLSLAGAAQAQQGVYFDDHRPDPQNPDHLQHPHVDGVLLRWEWAELEPQPDKFDFSPIERDIAPWVKAGKKVLIGVKPAGQHNRSTPAWVYDRVDRIDFTRSGKGTEVSVPQYWHPQFLPTASGLVQALGKKYADDRRIEAVMIGVGHLGFLTAAPNAGGSKAFLQAGWTPDRWKQYTIDLIGVYRRAFPNKPLFLRGSDLVLRIPKPEKFGFRASKPFFNDVRDDILFTAATECGVGVGCNGLEADPQQFLATGIPQLYERLAPGAQAGKYRLEISDDWPLWVNADRRKESPIDADKDNAHFAHSLENAIGGQHGLPKLGVSWIKLLKTDLDCTDPQHADYQPECEQKLFWLKRQMVPQQPRQ